MRNKVFIIFVFYNNNTIDIRVWNHIAVKNFRTDILRLEYVPVKSYEFNTVEECWRQISIISMYFLFIIIYLVLIRNYYQYCKL